MAVIRILCWALIFIMKDNQEFEGRRSIHYVNPSSHLSFRNGRNMAPRLTEKPHKKLAIFLTFSLEEIDI